MYFLRCFSLLLVSMLIVRPAMALEPFSGTLGAKFATESFFGRADETVNNGFDRADNSMRLFRGHVEALLESANAELSSAMNLFFDELSQSQKDVAGAYFSALQETEDSLRRSLADGSELVLDTGQVIAALSPIKTSPAIIGISTLTPLYDDYSGKITVVVNGINIGNEDNMAYGPDGPATVSNVTDNKIEFDITVDMTSFENDEVPVTIEIHDAGLLRTTVRRLPLTLRATPNLVGEIAATYTVTTFSPQVRSVPPEGQPAFRRGCSGGFSSRCTNTINENINPTDGFQIVPDSIIITPTFSNRCASRKGFRSEARNVSSNGFLLHIYAKSSKGRSCRISGRVTFEEIPRSAAQEVRITEFKPFRFSDGGVSFEIPLGATHTGYRLREAESGAIIPLAANSPLRGLRTVWMRNTTEVEVVPSN